MNIIKINNRLYKVESLWRSTKSSRDTDYFKNVLPFPYAESITDWQMKDMFLVKLKETQTFLEKKNKFFLFDDRLKKDCLLCGKKNVTTGYYELGSTRWDNGLLHYIKEHNVKPSDEFIDIIFRHEVNPRVLSRKKISDIKGLVVVKDNKRYLKLDRNQILIMDALMEHGGYKIYVDQHKKKIFRYSEHAGLLDFQDEGLEKIIISANTTRVDENDDDIYMPKNMIEAFDYEYIFHTHPPTPTVGGRAKVGVLYELPSISDIFHFIDHYNEGMVQGSIVICPEGAYIISKKDTDNKKIKIDEDEFYRKTIDTYYDVQQDGIKKYGTDFTPTVFYSQIAQDKTFIERVNKTINKFDIHIHYYSRVKDAKNRWIIDTIYVPVYVVEARLQR